MRSIRYVAFLAWFAAFAISTASAEPKKLILAHIGAPGSIYDLCAREYARRVNSLIGPEYEVVPEGASKHGGDNAILKKVKSGELAFGLPAAVMSALSPKFGVFELPYLIRNRDQVRKISDALLEPVLQPEVQKHGYRILALWDSGFRQMTNSVRPIKRPADMRGLRIRIPFSPWRAKLLTILGAVPVQTEYSEVVNVIQSKKVDGQESPLHFIKAAKLYEMQTYLSLSDYLYTPIFLTVSEEHFTKLPLNVQKILSEHSNSLRDWMFRTSILLESEYIDEIGEQMKVNDIDLEAFRQASRPIYGEFAKTVPDGIKIISIVMSLTGTSTELANTQEPVNSIQKK